MTNTLKTRLENIKKANEKTGLFTGDQMNMICDMIVSVVTCENLEDRDAKEVATGDIVKVKSPINGLVKEYLVLSVSATKRSITVSHIDNNSNAKFCYNIDDIIAINGKEVQ